jgi:hypothetical protein
MIALSNCTGYLEANSQYMTTSGMHSVPFMNINCEKNRVLTPKETLNVVDFRYRNCDTDANPPCIQHVNVMLPWIGGKTSRKATISYYRKPFHLCNWRDRLQLRPRKPASYNTVAWELITGSAELAHLFRPYNWPV